MTTPLTVTLDHMRLRRVILIRDGASNVTAQGEYDVLTATGQFAQFRTIDFTPTAQMQTQLNAMWDAGVGAINTKEGTVTLP